jgi:hypothetical protein
VLDLQESEMILEVAEIDIEAKVKSLICFRDMRLCLGIHTRTFEHMLLHLEDITEHALHQYNDPQGHSLHMYEDRLVLVFPRYRAYTGYIIYAG